MMIDFQLSSAISKNHEQKFEMLIAEKIFVRFKEMLEFLSDLDIKMWKKNRFRYNLRETLV